MSVTNAPEASVDTLLLNQRISTIRLRNPKKAYELFQDIYAFCIHHYALKNGAVPTVPPYDMVICGGGKGIMFNVGHLPYDLLSIIDRYVSENIIMS